MCQYPYKLCTVTYFTGVYDHCSEFISVHTSIFSSFVQSPVMNGKPLISFSYPYHISYIYRTPLSLELPLGLNARVF